MKIDMTWEEYNQLFHRAHVNEVAFKRVMDCDEELRKMVEMAVEAALEKFKAELVEKVASNTWSFQPTKWVGLDEYTKNRFQNRIKEESMTNLEIMDLVEHFLKVSNGGLE